MSFMSNQNVGGTERWISMIIGGAMVLRGLRRRSLGGLAMAVTGGGMLFRGLSGHCSLYNALGINSAEQSSQSRMYEGQRDIVQEASEDSFPASDAPSWTPTRVG